MGKNTPEAELDAVDRSILRQVQEDGRLTNAKLAGRLALSETPCWRRLKRLESEGYIESYQANLNRRKLGYGVLAFVQLSVSIHTDEATARFEDVVRSCPEIIACHNVTGQADFLLQVVAPDLDTYGQFIDRVFRKLPEIRAIHSSVSLREIKASNRLPLP